MDTSHTIIEDLFGEGQNQLTAARGYVGRSHTPEDMRSSKKKGTRPNIPDLTDFETLNQPPPFTSGPLYRRMEDERRNDESNLRPPPRLDFRDIHGDFQINEPRMQQQPPQGGQQPQFIRDFNRIPCKDAFNHIENCPICSNYFKKDVKFYWLIIAILIVVIIIMTRK